MRKIYAGIGSRETPPLELSHMQHIAAVLAHNDWTLRSGRAEGADTAFELAARAAMGKCEIYLPDKHEYTPLYDLKPDPDAWAYRDEHVGSVLACKVIARLLHPKGNGLSKRALELHARNTYQILGRDLNTPVDIVICYTPKGEGGGGTGQALRLAKMLGIQIIDLGLAQGEPGALHSIVNYILSMFNEVPYEKRL